MGRNWYAEWEEEKERREEEYWEQLKKEEAERKQKEEQERLEKEKQAKLENASPELKADHIYFIPVGNGREQLSFLPPIVKDRKAKTAQQTIIESEEISQNLSNDENGVF